MIKRMFLLIVLLFIMIGCVPEGVNFEPEEWNVYVRETHVNYVHVARIVDVEASVICYVYSYKSIDCMPLSETSLDY